MLVCTVYFNTAYTTYNIVLIVHKKDVYLDTEIDLDYFIKNKTIHIPIIFAFVIFPFANMVNYICVLRRAMKSKYTET